ncbi:Dabb family protein [Microbacterium sp. X-17]|uniref:Dabb family protein n=1 Tax=Microbacterium sp. X-17 TaxID=3144404 RepID=UPI0031F5593A
MTVRHVVVWKLSAEDAEQKAADAAEIVRRLGGLEGVVPSIRSLSVGTDVVSAGTFGDVALVADFDDEDGVEQYQVHPAHREAAGFIRDVVSSRTSVDFLV